MFLEDNVTVSEDFHLGVVGYWHIAALVPTAVSIRVTIVSAGTSGTATIPGIEVHIRPFAPQVFQDMVLIFLILSDTS